MPGSSPRALGPVRLKDVKAAPQQIVATARQLQNEGVISLRPETAGRLIE